MEFISEHQAEIIKVLFAVVAAAVVVTKIIDGLRLNKDIEEINAGKLNEFVSFLATLALFGLNYLGAPDKASEAQNFGVYLAALPIITYVIAGLSYLIHQAILIMQGRKSTSQPSAKVTVETTGGATANATAQAQPPTSTEVYRDNTVADSALPKPLG